MRDAKELYEIAQDMVDWCLQRGCQQLSETDKEVSLTCPNLDCPSRSKGENHRSFDLNRHTALYHCWHCGLKGIGLKFSKYRLMLEWQYPKATILNENAL